MRVFDLAEAKKKFFELFRDVENGETFGISVRGEIAALIQPPQRPSEFQKTFDDSQKIGRSARRKKGIAKR